MQESTLSASSSRPLIALPENEFACAALGRLPDSRLVFLCGPAGSGKSHLIRHAVDDLHSTHPQWNVISLTASAFAAGFAEASAQKSITAFQSSLRMADVFVCEEITALGQRHETQIQLIHLIDEVLARNGSVVLSSRLAPRELKGFSPRLVSRCRGGTFAGIELPGRESRIRLLAHFASSRRLQLANEYLAALADTLPVSPRELLSTVLRLESWSRLEQRPLDDESIARVLELDEQPPRPTLQRIARAVAREFDVSVASLRDAARNARATRPRHCAMYLARILTAHPLRQIANWFGRTNHSSVIHACRRIEASISDDHRLSQHLTRVRNALGRMNSPAPRRPQSEIAVHLARLSRTPR